MVAPAFGTQSKVVAQLTLLVAITGPAPWQLSCCTAEDDQPVPTEAPGSARAYLSLSEKVREEECEAAEICACFTRVPCS